MKKDITNEIGWIVIKDGVIYEFETWKEALKYEKGSIMTKSYYTNHWLPENETE